MSFLMRKAVKKWAIKGARARRNSKLNKTIKGIKFQFHRNRRARLRSVDEKRIKQIAESSFESGMNEHGNVLLNKLELLMLSRSSGFS